MADRNNDYVYFSEVDPEASYKKSGKKTLEQWKRNMLEKWIKVLVVCEPTLLDTQQQPIPYWEAEGGPRFKAEYYQETGE